ncbi:Fic family protein [Aerococcaceae bacterium NML190938]|nr:Fic family protein [Aerococcaceae bacterium NML190938]MCW6675189.1 Fic family protein [Aerococcaceae bacterium NML171108]MCW6677111.1 Fic family protein [Aerococcaceae bacterium NML180378]
MKRLKDEKSYDELSKLRALELWDSGEINRIEIGTFEGLRQIHAKLFHDIPGYNAGTLRKVNISKDNLLFASSLYLPQAVKAVEDLPQSTFEEIIDKYIEMNIVHPFIEGNGRATRFWLDQILKKELNLCIDWQRIDKQEYLDFMRLSPTNSKYIKQLLKSGLTEKIHNREIFMKGIDKSYEYESSRAQDLSTLIKSEKLDR